MTSPMRVVARALALATVVLIALAARPTASGATGSAAGVGAERRVIIAVLSDDPATTLSATAHKSDEPHDSLLRHLAATRLAVALVSTDLGTYDRRQTLLDVSQGTRQQRSLYGSAKATIGYPTTMGRGCIEGWSTLVANAHHASVTLVPGLLAASVPGGAAFVGVDGDASSRPASILAADRRGCVADVSVGSSVDLAARAATASGAHGLVVVGLPSGAQGRRALDQLASQRSNGELLVAIDLPPTQPDARVRPSLPNRFYHQTPLGLLGAGVGGRVDSSTTRQPGLVASIDIAPTALDHLGLAIPSAMRGQVMTTKGSADPDRLERLRRRWADVRNNRQLASYRTVFLLSLLLLLVLGVVRGLMAGLWVGLRAFGLAVLWWPGACLAVALASPRAASLEVLAIGAAALGAALLTDLALPWPRGPVAPALALVVGLGLDLATGGHVLTQSVLGPSVTTGSRFYGISNELEPILPVVVLAGLAAVSTWRRWDRQLSAALYLTAGLVLAVVVGWGRLGADVGGVVTVGAGFAGAVLLGGGRLTKAKILLLVATPVAALAGLVGLDLVSHGGDHLSNNLTRSGGGTDLWELVARRYQLAFHVVTDPAMLIRLGIAVLAVVFVARNRDLLIRPNISRPWTAALVGGLAAGAAGALSNDSGPVLFVNAVFTLVGVVAYLRGGPEALPTPGEGRSPGRSGRWDTVGTRG